MDAARALARDRVIMSPWGHGLMALLTAYAVYLAAARGQWLPAALCLAVWPLFMAVRTVVTPRYVHVQLGVFGPKIPIDSIVDARPIEASSFVTLGWGIRYDFQGAVTYNVPAFGRQYLHIEYKTGRRNRIVRVMCHDAARLAAAIAEARPAAAIPVESPSVEAAEPLSSVEPGRSAGERGHR